MPRSLRRRRGGVVGRQPEQIVEVDFDRHRLVHRRSIQTLAILTFLIWVCIIVLGRLIAYDHVWGSWSPSEGQ